MSASTEQAPATLMIADLRHEHFAPLINNSFTLHLPEGKTLQMRLTEATTSRHSAPGFRPAFSLIFRCPELPAGQYIVQGSYAIEHPTLGKLDYFMAPVQPDQDGMRYECVFA